ncbi:MAG: hypothetical protein A3E82_06135 [Gammaproteobacteria bacterium RIFCSPHIGHO2_12_FULL_38_11]|nr:MAG: hypothetical protein A3E82_06135 [Gammaproteobacteria bacterium RIFCSPHIGHO2_12_FULL_38_11]
MKKISPSLALLTLFLVPLFANAAPFSAAPATTQAYHSVSYTANPAPTTAPVVPAAQPVVAAPPSDVNSGAAVINSNLSAPVAAVQASPTEQETVDQRLQNLEDSNHAIGRAIFTINQNIAVLQEQQMQHADAKKSLLSNFSFNADDTLTLIFAGISLLLMGMLMGRLLMRRNQSVVKINHGHEKSEYDFMGTDEAIPAKLDLARSYIAMGNHTDAKMELKIVIQKGNEEQKMIAEALMHKINRNTHS